jgi:hypothetical protein
LAALFGIVERIIEARTGPDILGAFSFFINEELLISKNIPFPVYNVFAFMPNRLSLYGKLPFFKTWKKVGPGR